jgi:hypothetical protein
MHLKKKNKEVEISPFEEFYFSLENDEGILVKEYLDSLRAHILLPKEERDEMVHDFEKAILFLCNTGVPLKESLERLAISNLGGFYSRPPVNWFSLDDSAKIYPLSMDAEQMAIFRQSVYLKADVVPDILQIALTFTIKRFPSFATTVKKGFFWHYLDTSKRRYGIESETGIPCMQLNIAYSSSQTFRVIWYKNRISVEFFHILTDGTGALAFLKALIAQYLTLLGVKSSNEGIVDINERPEAEEVENAYSRASHIAKNEIEKPKMFSGIMDKPATQMSGKLSFMRPCQVFHFNLDAKKVKDIAKLNKVTVTSYILSRLLIAGKSATDDLEGDISLQVPINMRQFYPSRTFKNFVLYCGIRFPIGEIRNDAIFLQKVSKQLSEKSSIEEMNRMLSSTRGIVKAMQYVPLSLKSKVAGFCYGFLGDRIFSNMLSNIGVVRMPPEYSKYIDKMDFVLGSTITNRASCAMITFGNTTTLSISKQTSDPSFEDAMYALFCSDGIIPSVEGSKLNDI